MQHHGVWIHLGVGFSLLLLAYLPERQSKGARKKDGDTNGTGS